MLKTSLKKILMPIYFVVSTLIVEVVTFRLLEFGIVPDYFVYNLSILLVIAFFVFIIPNFVAQYVLYSVILLVQIVFVYINYSLFKIYGDLFSLDMIRLVGEAGAAITTNFVYFPVILQLVSIAIILMSIGAILLKICRKTKIQIRQHFSVITILILLLVQCFSVTYFFVKRNQLIKQVSFDDVAYTESDSFLINTSILKRKSYQRFGTYGYFTNLFFNGGNSFDNELENNAIEYFESGNIYDGNCYNEQDLNKKIFSKGKGNNVIVIMMESLEWFGFGNGTYDYSVNNLSAEMTPNIYNLINSNRSMISTNFYAKSKTNISEIYGIAGSFPVGNSVLNLAYEEYSEEDNSLGYTMPHVMQENNYTTTYIHSNEISFYDRNLTHNNLGFDTVVGKDRVITKDGEDLLKDAEGNVLYKGNDLKWNYWEAEGDFVRNTIDYIVPKNYNEKPFYSFYLNVSSHGSYEATKTEVDYLRYKDYVMYGEDGCEFDQEEKIWKKKESTANDDYSEWYKNVLEKHGKTDASLVKEMVCYECGVIGLDDAIGVIIDKLNEYNIYDDTTLLLYSDHYAYYDGLAHRFKGFDKNDISSIELNTIPMIISSPCLEEYAKLNYPSMTSKYLINDRFCSAYDIVPTLFDILGIKFNENLYLGQSLFKPNDIAYMIDGKMHDMIIYYSNTGGLFSPHVHSYDMETIYRNESVDSSVVDMFKYKSNQVLTKINFINILNNEKLFKKLTKI